MAKSGENLIKSLTALKTEQTAMAVKAKEERAAQAVKIREAEKDLANWNADLDKDWKLLVGSASLVMAAKDRVNPASLSGYLSQTMTDAQKVRHRDQLAALINREAVPDVTEGEGRKSGTA
jgi:hypothetical protein